VFEVVCLALTMALGEGPTPPTAPTVKEPETPTAEAPHRPGDTKKSESKGDSKTDKPGQKPGEKSADRSGEKSGDRSAEKSGDKSAAKAGEKPADKASPEDKARDKPEEKAPEKSAEAKPARKGRSERGPVSTPPSLTTNALRGEMRGGGGGGEGARTSERAKLEQLASDITKAREALRADTAKLEQMLKGRGEGMPVGDPLAEGGPSATPLSEKDLQKEQIDSVSKALKGMKPEQAAAIVARLDRLLAAEILRRMRPADAGAVMGQLKPEVAAELATTIATKKPGPPGREGKSP
jgi:flagellar motility protein MotE (MotC chaperone)